jgi:hypothetical protein
MLVVTGLIVAVAAAGVAMSVRPVYAPMTCASCFAPGQQEGAAQNSAPGHLFGGGGPGGASGIPRSYLS